MPPTTIHLPPSLDSFTTLADHQSQTPTNFFGAKPVLHYHASGVRALTARDQLSKLPIFAPQANGLTRNGTAVEGEVSDRAVDLVIAFVTSENLTLFNQTTSTGISIPYPAISLHAIQRLSDPADASREVQGLYMQLEISDSNGDDDEPDFVELTLIPPPADTESTSIQALFEAVSNCSNLHPDPGFEDEDMEDDRIIFEGSVGYEGISGLPGVQRGASDGGLPPPFPGSGGWITAENVSEYFDEEGNWIGEDDENREALGEGAGRIRSREELDDEGLNGHDESDDNKRPRTD